MLHKCLQYETISSDRIFHQRVQLSIGKGTSSALAELHIRRSIQNACLPERFYVSKPLLCHFSAFDHNGFITVRSQQICAK